MARRSRGVTIGYYHVYNRGVDKDDIFYSDDDKRLFLKLIGDFVNDSSVKVFAYCLMQNHIQYFLHSADGKLDRFMKRLQGRYASYVNCVYDRVGYLFQGRYQSRQVATTKDALTLIRYIHRNSLEIGYSLDSFQWSSYPNYIGLVQARPWLDCQYFFGLFQSDPRSAISDFITFHHSDSESVSHHLIVDKCG